MNIDYIGIGIIILILAYGFIFYLLCRNQLFPYLNKKNELKEKELKNKKYEIFLESNPSVMEEELNKYLDRYVKRYIIYKFASNKISYIGSEQVETMIKDLTKYICVEISDFYIFYISMLTSIDDQVDLIRFINTRVKNLVIENVTNYNKSEQIVNL